MISFAKVEVKAIQSDVSRSTFEADRIEQLAAVILASGGLWRPLILRQTGLESYQVLHGDLEYYAAVRAREQNPRQGEMVNAFVLSPQDEAIAPQYLALLQEPPPQSSPSSLGQAAKTEQTMGIESWISSFETRLAEMRELIHQTSQDHGLRLKALEKATQAAPTSDLLTFINTADVATLTEVLSQHGLAIAKIKAMADARQQQTNQAFASYRDLAKQTKGLGSDGVLRLMDAWQRFQG